MGDDTLYKAVKLDELGISGDTVSLNVYFRVPTTDNYSLLIAAGEKITPQKMDDLKLLSGSNLYIHALAPYNQAVEALKKTTHANAFKSEILGEEAGLVLKNVYLEIMKLPVDSPNPALLTQQLARMSEAVLAVVAPDVKDAKLTLLKHLQNIHLMNQAAAITAIGTLCMIANDFTSKTAFQSLSYAAMLMDASLADLSREHLETYYRSRDELPQYILDRIRFHPVKSQQIVDRLPIMTDGIRQLILSHHELYNGQGYHRGLKTSQVSTLAGLLSLAVDLFENIKGAEMRGDPMSLRDAILRFEEWGIPTHARRHSARLVANLMAFLGIEPAAAVRWA